MENKGAFTWRAVVKIGSDVIPAATHFVFNTEKLKFGSAEDAFRVMANANLAGLQEVDAGQGDGKFDLLDFSQFSGQVTVVDGVLQSSGTQFKNFEHYVGSAFGDTFKGGAADDRFKGSGGNDTLQGDAGNDYLDGGKDTDTALFDDGGKGPLTLSSGGSAPANFQPDQGDNAPFFTVKRGAETDTLHSIEKFKLSDQADTFIVASGTDLKTILEIDGGGQPVGALDVLDLSHLAPGLKITDGKLGVTAIKDFEKLILTSGNDVVILSGNDANTLRQLETRSGSDVVYSAVTGLTITFGGDQSSHNVLLNAGYGTVVNAGAGQLTAVVANNVLLNGMKAGDVLMTKAGTVLHGATGEVGSESKWVISGNVKYGLNTQGDLVVNINGKETFIAGYKGGPSVDLNHQTAGVFIGLQSHHAEKLIDLTRPYNENIKVTFQAANQAYFTQTGQTVFKDDPLILDLNGDGVNLTPQSIVAPTFDIAGTGFAVHTGWVQSDDGMLVVDKNANGVIDNAGEMFGGQGTVGFAALASYDDNHDGVVDANDTHFGDLRIWQDVDGNAVSSASELFTLDQLGIASINVASTPQTGVSIADNTVIATEVFTRIDGSTGVVSNVNYSTDTFHSRYLGDTSVSEAASAMPNLKGFGTLADLHVAMTLDPSLIDFVNDTLPNLTALDLASLRAEAMPILLAWAEAVPLLDANGDPQTVNPVIGHNDIPILVTPDESALPMSWTSPTNSPTKMARRTGGWRADTASSMTRAIRSLSRHMRT